jgi:hypothetical protein
MFVLVPKYTQRYEYEYRSFTVLYTGAKKSYSKHPNNTDILNL